MFCLCVHQDPSSNTCVIPPVICYGWFSCGIHLLACYCPKMGLFGFFLSHYAACTILAAQSGIEPGPSAVNVQGPNHSTAREFPPQCFLVFHRPCLLSVPPEGGVHSTRTGPGSLEGPACLMPRLVISGSFSHIKRPLLPSLLTLKIIHICGRKTGK